MSDDIRQLYVLTNPALPGLVKVGMTTAGIESRMKSLSSPSNIPEPYRCFGLVEFPGTTQKDLYDCEQEAHRRLRSARHSEHREFFTSPPEEALSVLEDVKRDALRYVEQGLSVTGAPVQRDLPGVRAGIKPQGFSRAEAARRAAREDKKARRHWHVWKQSEEADNKQVIGLTLDPTTYWSKSGAVGRVKREGSSGTHADFMQCNDIQCPNYGKRRNEAAI